MQFPNLLDDLTESQRTAVSHVDGPLLVLAGPGSGKTRVITRRVARLVSLGIPAWQILAVTFTNKAAGEMRERIDHLVPADIPGRRGLVVTTFHAFCARVLRRHAVRAGLDPAFVIYDSADQRELVKKAIADVGLDESQVSPGGAHSVISKAKNDLLGPSEFQARARDFRERGIARIYAAYQQSLAENKAVDFDDLLLKTSRLLGHDEEVRAELADRFRYLLIDEYQDTNQAQFAIAMAIAGSHGNICVVGDPDQSIYGWRGADLRNILHFEKHFPNVRVVPLGENFRSTGHIVAASAALIAQNARRKGKKLFTSLEDGERVRVQACADELSEAARVVERLVALSDNGVPWGQMAVLYRVNALSRVLEDALRRSGIPYQIARGTAFFDRKEVRDALAYLRLLANPSDSVSLERVVNFPTRGLGDTSLGRIEEAARRWRVPLLEALRRAEQIDDLSPRAKAAALGFTSMVDRWRQDALALGGERASDLSAMVSMVMAESGLQELYRDEEARRGRDEGESRVANLEELVSAAAQWQPPPSELEGSAIRPLVTLVDRLAAWLESVALVSDADAVDAGRGAVTLMTLHAAKGLEFDAVCIVGLEEGLLPHSRFDGAIDDIEEERRLCYVGMTRARRWLSMTWARSRAHRGTTQRRIASSFLLDLPPEHVQGVERRSDGCQGSAALGRSLERSGGRREIEDGVDEIPDWEAGDVPPRIVTASGQGRPAAGRLGVGDYVCHSTFGKGRITEVMPRGRSTSVRVNFELAGPKTLVLEYAKLERL